MKLGDLSTCNDLIAKHGAALQRSLNELDGLRIPYESSEKLKAVNERATLFRITSNAMINACRDFLELAETHSRKWQRALQYEQEQRVHLEETIEQLAKQHNSLERAFRSAPGRAANPTKSFSEGEWGHLASVHLTGALSTPPSASPSSSWLCLHGPQYTRPLTCPHWGLSWPTLASLSVALYFPGLPPTGNSLPVNKFSEPSCPLCGRAARWPLRARGHGYPGKGSVRKGTWATNRLTGFGKERGL